MTYKFITDFEDIKGKTIKEIIDPDYEAKLVIRFTDDTVVKVEFSSDSYGSDYGFDCGLTLWEEQQLNFISQEEYERRFNEANKGYEDAQKESRRQLLKKLLEEFPDER